MATSGSRFAANSRKRRTRTRAASTPGQRQFRDPVKLREYYRGKSGGLSDSEFDVLFARRIENHARHAACNYRGLLDLATGGRSRSQAMDDTTADHVRHSIDGQVVIAELPTTMEAASTLHEAGIKVLMGTPNLVRGGSHSGNIATADLARTGLLDILSSEYVPSSPLIAALRLPKTAASYSLPAAIRTVSKTPADVVGLTDRGETARGKRADLIQVHQAGNAVSVRSVWCGGRRVA